MCCNRSIAGDRLGNKLLELCSGSFSWENVTRVGELELVYNPQTSVNCALVYQKDWRSELGGLLSTGSP